MKKVSIVVIMIILVVILISAASVLAAEGLTVDVKPVNDAAVAAVNPRPAEIKEYDWLGRQKEIKDLCVSMKKVDLIFIGDSIIHYFAGNPKARFVRGEAAWNRYFGSYDVVNMGFGTDRTQHVLWRLEHGAVDGISPRVAVILIGSNNIGGGTQKFQNTPEEISEGVRAICKDIRRRLPQTKILLLGILPRSHAAQTMHWKRFHDGVRQVNRLISIIPEEVPLVRYMDIGDRFLIEDGSISHELMSDYLHPNEKGYEVLASAIAPVIAEMMQDKTGEEKTVVQQNTPASPSEKDATGDVK